MKSVIRTPCWFVHEIIGAAAFDEANAHTRSFCGLSYIILEKVTPSRGKTADAASGEHEIAASVSGSRIVPCGITKSMGSSIPAEIGKSWNGNEYRLTAQCARVDDARAWKLPSCSGEVPVTSIVSRSPFLWTAIGTRINPGSKPVVSRNTTWR